MKYLINIDTGRSSYDNKYTLFCPQCFADWLVGEAKHSYEDAYTINVGTQDQKKFLLNVRCSGRPQCLDDHRPSCAKKFLLYSERP